MMRNSAVLVALACAAPAASADPPRVVLSTDAVEIARETYALALDYRVSEHVALRGDLGYDSRRYFDSDKVWDYKGGMKGAFGVLAFLAAPYEGVFADVELRVRNFETTDICNTNLNDRVINHCNDGWTAWSPQLGVGWQTTFHVGLSLAASVGVGYEFTNRDDGLTEYSGAVYLGEIRVGYAF
jgi:hypothetical protein